MEQFSKTEQILKNGTNFSRIPTYILHNACGGFLDVPKIIRRTTRFFNVP
jgi:hypothetical protein